MRRKRYEWVVAALCATTACVGEVRSPDQDAAFPGRANGEQEGPREPAGGSPSGEPPNGGASAGGPTDDPVDGPTPVLPGEAAPSSPQLRLLSADEYRASVEALLGVEASSQLAYTDAGEGYSIRADTRVDENLLAALLDEADRLAGRYVAERLRSDFRCFEAETADEACVAQVVTRLAARAYRQPVADEERTELLALHRQVAAETGDADLAARTLVARILTSARFLYRREVGVRGTLGDYERATLIAYATTGSMPDARLLADAAEGRLDEATMRGHVRRLVGTDAGKRTLVKFVRQWLRLRSLEDMAATPQRFPKLASAAQGRALLAELDAYVREAIERGASLRALLTGERTFANRHTAPLYGAELNGDTLQPLPFDPTERRGILSLASVAAAQASVSIVDSDRPIVRGLTIKTRLFCEDVGLPVGIDTASAADMAGIDSEALAALTIREQYETIMNQGRDCVACHAQFMPLGFLFGNFDALGRFVTSRRGRAIDVKVDEIIIGGEPRSYADHLALIAELSGDEDAARCLAINVAAFVTGRAAPEELTNVVSEMDVDADTPLATLFEEVIMSPAVQKRGAAR